MNKNFLRVSLLAMLFIGSANASVIYTEAFETDGLGTRYSASGAGGAGLGCCQNWSLHSQDEGEESDVLTGFSGLDFWSGTDLNDGSLPTGFSETTPRDLLLNTLELDGQSNSLTVALASANMDQGSDFLRVFAVDADTGVRSLLDFFDGSEAGSMSGVVLSNVFQDISYDLSSLGITKLIIGFEAWNTSNNEAIGIDNVRVAGVIQESVDVPEPSTLAIFGFALAALRFNRKK